MTELSDESDCTAPQDASPNELKPPRLVPVTDNALGDGLTHNKPKKPAVWLSATKNILRSLLFDIPLMLLFAAYAGAVLLHRINDDYLYPQLKLMRFISEGRDLVETTYYHRVCDERDVSAASVEELVLNENATKKEAELHMLTHGVSMYPNLLTPKTASELREFIDIENRRQKGWFVIENEHRYSWGIDVNMHPALHEFWKELGSNELLVGALQEIVGPDPAIIEFTAITSAYGAVDQHDHQDVIPPGSAAKFAHSFVPSYSLFIPLQDTTYDMGATHVCPGSHLCSEGCESYCPDYNLAVSGPLGEGVWKRGWGALVNQQTTHKGMGHFKKGALDRIVIIATFAPRPQTHRGLETRMIAQGGSYSLKWSQWGHTFSDFVHAEKRMTEPQKTLRSLGVIEGNGWNYATVASMRITNFEVGFNDGRALRDLMEEGGIWYLPLSWQGKLDGEKEEIIKSFWYDFLIGTVKRTETKLRDLNMMVLGGYTVLLLLLDATMYARRKMNRSFFLSALGRLVITHVVVAALAFWLFNHVQESNWAKDIRSQKAYRLPTPDIEAKALPSTIPAETDILIQPEYRSDYLASYSRVLDVAHPGNNYWETVKENYSAGYSDLSPTLKLDFCTALMDWIPRRHRFLTLDEARFWVELTDPVYLVQLCNKELLASSSGLTKSLLHTLDSLRTEAKLGRWHDKVIHRRIIPRLLDKLEKVILPNQLELKNDATARKLPRRPVNLRVSSSLSPVPSRDGVPDSKRYTLPSPPLRQEPFSGAWLQEGDVVEAMYNCEYDEWYRGVIASVVTNEADYDIEYADGDIDEGMKRRCVRPFVPYRINETVEALTLDDTFNVGTIKAIYNQTSGVTSSNDEVSGLFYDLVLEDGKLAEMIPMNNLRRVRALTPEVDAMVEAQFNGGDEWFRGVVVADNGDQTYAIRYDDGDYEERVPAALINRVDV